jgi:hypothetical protein
VTWTCTTKYTDDGEGTRDDLTGEAARRPRHDGVVGRVAGRRARPSLDHGVDFTEKAGGTVFVPLKADDPLIPGPDHILDDDPNTARDESADNLPADQRFMVLTRVKNRPGPDKVLGTADDIQDGTNTDSPWVDQSQTYTSHPSHQVFLRDYELNAAGDTVATGKLLQGTDGGMATSARTKSQARALLGINLVDADALNIPLLATDQYGGICAAPPAGYRRSSRRPASSRATGPARWTCRTTPRAPTTRSSTTSRTTRSPSRA